MRLGYKRYTKDERVCIIGEISENKFHSVAIWIQSGLHMLEIKKSNVGVVLSVEDIDKEKLLYKIKTDDGEVRDIMAHTGFKEGLRVVSIDDYLAIMNDNEQNIKSQFEIISRNKSLLTEA